MTSKDDLRHFEDDDMFAVSEVFVTCPCGQAVTICKHTETGKPLMTHGLPTCYEFNYLLPAEYLAYLRSHLPGTELEYAGTFRYFIEVVCREGTVIWFHDDTRQFHTMPLAKRFIERMNARYGRNSVSLHQVTRMPLKGDELVPQSDPDKKIFVFTNADVPLLPSPEPRRLGKV